MGPKAFADQPNNNKNNTMLMIRIFSILFSSLQSVMHYSNDAFSRNGEPTLISKIYPRLRFGQRQQLSILDVEEINRLYECKKREFDPTILHDDMTPDQALEMRDQLEGSDDGQ